MEKAFFPKHGNILWFVDVGGVSIARAGVSWNGEGRIAYQEVSVERGKRFEEKEMRKILWFFGLLCGPFIAFFFDDFQSSL